MSEERLLSIFSILIDYWLEYTPFVERCKLFDSGRYVQFKRMQFRWLHKAESSHKRLPTAFIVADSGPCRGHALLTIVRKERPGPLPCFIHTAA